MPRTNVTGASPDFVVDYNATARSDGRQVDFANTPASRVPAGETKKVLPAGTIVAQNAAGKIVARADVAAASVSNGTAWAGTETAMGFLISDAEEGSKAASLSGQGVFLGGVFYRELLPDHGNAAFDDWITEITDKGSQVRLETYSDSRAL